MQLKYIDKLKMFGQLKYTYRLKTYLKLENIIKTN